MQVDPLWALAALGSVISGVIAAGIKKVWVWGWVYTDKEDDLAKMTDDRDFWRDAALTALGYVGKALDPPSRGKVAK